MTDKPGHNIYDDIDDKAGHDYQNIKKAVAAEGKDEAVYSEINTKTEKRQGGFSMNACIAYQPSTTKLVVSRDETKPVDHTSRL